MTAHDANRNGSDPNGEEGYLLIGLVVACFLIVLALGIAAPRVAKQLERDREVESEYRAQQYVRAIQLYFKRNNRYPTSVDELMGNPTGSGGMSLGGNAMNVRYLRQKYKDPLTGGEYRMIHFGEAKTEVKGFFGEPLQGMAAGNLGAVSGMQSNLGGAQTGSSGGGFSATGSTSTAAGSTSTASGAAGASGTSSGISSTSATTFQGSKGAIIGVGSDAKGHGLVEWNGSENIEDWEFLYDPRVEQLKAKVSIFGGTPAAAGSGSLGSGFAPASGSTGLGSSTGLGGTGSSNSGTSSAPTGTATPQ